MPHDKADIIAASDLNYARILGENLVSGVSILDEDMNLSLIHI